LGAGSRREMDLIRGIRYNLRGLYFGVTNGKLLFLGLVRFFVVIIIMLILAGVILAYHNQILDLIWSKPQSSWLVWLWHFLSWLLSLFLVGVSAIFSYLLSQILFSVLIMDLMSRITERKMKGLVVEPEKMPIWKLFFYLVKQEIPRAVIPVVVSVVLMVLAWFVALGPVMIFISSGIAILFLAWDNTDLIPARRLFPFKARFRLLLKTILFHLGFGLPFLIPGLNLVFLSFAPVGATLYYLDKYKD